jgi:TolB protein
MKKLNIKIQFIAGLLLLLIHSCDTVDPQPPVMDTPRDEAPAWSPDGNFIAYNHFDPDVDEHTNTYGLYILNLETGERTLVIEGPAFNPDWSPDGEWIAFNSVDIFRIRANGSDLVQISEIGSSFFPAWRPDGERLAFDTPYQNERGANTIWLINPDGAELKKVADPIEGEIRNSKWSPDGTYLLHYRYLKTRTGAEIFVMDTLGNNEIRLTKSVNGITNRSPSWSPDGAWIAWHTNNGIWVMRSDGSDQRHLTEGETPSWSPDSQRIVFSKPTPDEKKIVLWIIKRDGSGLRQITF